MRLGAALEQARAGLGPDAADLNLADLLEFFADRLKVQQRDAGVRYDLIDAVFALGGEDDLVRLLARVEALQQFVETPEGADLLAARIRGIAETHHVPILEAPPLARALYTHTELGEQIPEKLYTAVAEVLAYVFQLRSGTPGLKPLGDLQIPPELDPLGAHA